MLEFRNVSYLYGKNTPFAKDAVQNLSFTLKDGITLGLIGHTGSGKSTTARMMNALLKPIEGQIFLDGDDIYAKGYDTKSVRYRVGLVFQYPEYQLFEETVYKDIAFGPKNMGLSDAEIKERVADAAAFVGLQDKILNKSPFELSGGQKRRVAIAGVIAMRPKILVLDEPAAGLDPQGRNEILFGLENYRKQLGGSIVIISHSMEDVAGFADEVLVLDHGRKTLFGSPEDVFSHVEELENAGLTVPEVTKILYKLREKGMPVDTHAVTVAQAAEKIRGAFAD